MKKVIAFDLDGTLAPSKSPVPNAVVEALGKLLDNFQVCVISGGKFAQFEEQLLMNLIVDPGKLRRLHIMPTCGTSYYVFSPTDKKWRQVYAENFSTAQKRAIVAALKQGVDELSYHEKQIWGEQIEDRGSQITFSALGQKAPVEYKMAWDPTGKKKVRLRDYVAVLIPSFEVRVGGTTSVDITKRGVDKAYGMKKLMEVLKINKEDILFFGDRLQEGGNDYPVKAMGIDSLEVSHWQDTLLALTAMLHVL
jgi:HAD superfamily hydrolase (TIGR01484 family)